MSSDVFENWKNQRFVVAPRELVDDGVILVILSDYKYWVDRTDELVTWCKARGAEQQGMTVVIPNETLLTEFVLRWA